MMSLSAGVSLERSQGGRALTTYSTLSRRYRYQTIVSGEKPPPIKLWITDTLSICAGFSHSLIESRRCAHSLPRPCRVSSFRGLGQAQEPHRWPRVLLPPLPPPWPLQSPGGHHPVSAVSAWRGSSE